MSVQAPAGAESLVALVGARLDGSPLAVMLDIDGTLAPIAPRPEHAAVPPATFEVLRRLVALPGVVVALVSGRSVDDARRMVNVHGTWIIGNHGLELRTPEGELTAIPEARDYETAVAVAARALAPLESTIPGSIIENKRWSLSVHYRLVEPNAVRALKERATEVARATGLRTTEGKRIVELRPPIPTNKGTEAVALAERVSAAGDAASLLYAGDDNTDEDAFRALRARSPRAVTVRIMADSDRLDGPTHAEFVLASPDELRHSLEWIVARRARS